MPVSNREIASLRKRMVEFVAPFLPEEDRYSLLVRCTNDIEAAILRFYAATSAVTVRVQEDVTAILVRFISADVPSALLVCIDEETGEAIAQFSSGQIEKNDPEAVNLFGNIAHMKVNPFGQFMINPQNMHKQLTTSYEQMENSNASQQPWSAEWFSFLPQKFTFIS